MELKKRFVALVTAATMLCSVLPVNVLALEQSKQDDTGLCEHHQQHDEHCGYVQAKEEMPCLHEHDETCYTQITHCTHIHDTNCYGSEVGDSETLNPSEVFELEPINCTHQCSKEQGCIETVLDCKHIHDETCGYSPAVLGSPCTYVCPTCANSNSEESISATKVVTAFTFDSNSENAPVYTNDRWEVTVTLDNENQQLSQQEIIDLLPKQVTLSLINPALQSNESIQETVDISWELPTDLPDEVSNEFVANAVLPQHYQFDDSITSIELVVRFDIAQPYQQTTKAEAVDLDTLRSHEVNTTISPEGTKINLFDYWLSDDAAERFNADHQPLNNGSENHNNDLSEDQQRKGVGINKGHAFKFIAHGGDWQGYNRWTSVSGNNSQPKPYYGIVKNTLVNGYPELSAFPKDFTWSEWNNNIYDNDNDKIGSLEYLFDPNKEHQGKISFKNVENLLQVDDKGYYYYDANENFARFDETSNKFILYNKPAIFRSNSNDPNLGQFFPFQSEEQVSTYYKLDENGEFAPNYDINPASDLVNHYFGLSMETRFVHKNNGKTYKGDDITYEFEGDDDVWLFIDDVLVADLGGIHDKASFSINFATGNILVNGKEYSTIKKQFNSIDKNNEANTTKFYKETFANNTYHKLKLFYLERGNHESNLKLKYNLLSIPESELVKVNQMGKPVEGAKFSLYKADDTYSYSEQDDLLFTGQTDDKGNIYLRDDSGLPMTFAQFYNEYGTQYYVLKEENELDGYRKLDEIKLYYHLIDKNENIGFIESDNENIWNTGAYAQAKVMTIAPNKIRYEDTNHNIKGSLDLADTEQVKSTPLMFAVVFQKNDNGIWLAMYGDALTGWNVAKDNSMTSIINAAYQNPYLFELDTSGAFRVDIDNLPGKVDQYYWFLNQTSHQDKAKYYVAYYYSEAKSLNDANKDNTFHIVNQTQPTNEYKDFVREFSTKLYVPNIRNSLLVHKMNERMQPLNGATFALYKESDVTINADGTYTLSENAQFVDQGETSTLDNMEGGIVFPSEGNTLNIGTYYLIETQAPTGYNANPKPIKVIVDNSGVYVDAGDKNDNVWVARSVGMIVRSMLQFASDDLVDSTLHDIKAQLLTADAYDSNKPGWSDWNDKPSLNDELHLQFEEHNPVLDYGLIDSETTHHSFPGLICDSGWSKLAIRQCLAHDKEGLNNLKQDLEDRDLTKLFSGLSTVIVKDESIEETGDLIVSKEVIGQDGDVTKAFSFKVTLADTSINGQYYQMNFENGVAQFTLHHGETVKATGLPTGIDYTVTEDEANKNGYVTSIENGSGKISNSETLVKFTNQKVGTGNLTVKKTVTGKGDTTREWNFKVTLTNPLINGTYGDMTFTNGVATFTLKDKESKTAKDLPNGIEYKVEETEANTEGYTTSVNDDQGTISEDTPVVEFINAKQPTGGLTIKKVVTGDGDQGKEWNFTLELPNNKDINGKYGDVEFKNGVAQFQLKHGQEVNVSNLPLGIKYTVSEKEDGLDGYQTKVDNGSGTISEATIYVTFTNHKQPTGGLTIEKIVEGKDGDTSREWNFTLELPDNKNINGKYGEVTFINGVATFTLKHGDKVTVDNLPVNSKYLVKEEQANKDGYETSSVKEQGTIKQGTIEVKFTNKKLPVLSSLKVTKFVTGNAGDKTKAWNFTVKLDDGSINGKYGDMDYVNGEATFTLVSNESKVATNIPVGTKYTVTEAEANLDGYQTRAENWEGEINKNGSVVTFINHKDLIPPLPITSDISIEKIVSGEAGDITKEWHFTLTLSNTTIKGKYGDLTFVDGKAEFTLKHGDRVTANGLPINIEYSVTESEANKDGYVTSIENGSGKIGNSETFVKFTNHKDATGSLKVSKVVTGNAGDHNQSYPMEVKLSDTSITGNYGQMHFDKGVANFSLNDGQSVEANGLPSGIRYTVNELNVYGHSVSYQNREGIIGNDTVINVVVTNHKDATGSLKVSKVVTGNAGDHNQSYPMEVKLSDTSITGNYGQMYFDKGVANFSLNDGQSVEANGLPAGLSYTVNELNAYGHSVSYQNQEGVIVKNTLSEVIVTNHKDSGGTGGDCDEIDLTVQKVWKLDNGGKASESVTIELLRDGSHYDQIVLNDANNWIATWWNLDGASKWSVREINVPQGFTSSVTQDGLTFTITNDDDPDIKANKPSRKDNQPNTGDTTSLNIWMTILAISGIAAIVLFVYSKLSRNKK